MDLDLKGKKAIVTGGTRGIGRAIAKVGLPKNFHSEPIAQAAE